MQDIQGGHMKAVGSRAQVMHGNAKHTSGGLTKEDLKYNRSGRIVSRRKSSYAKRMNRLAGYPKYTKSRRSMRR